MTSSRVIPIPLSLIVIVFASSSKLIRTRKSASFSNKLPSDSALKRSLSAASAALETSSRRKISLFEYKEWIINLSSLPVSALKV